jgi:hypothetical protein
LIFRCNPVVVNPFNQSVKKPWLPVYAEGFVYLADNTTSATTGALTGRPVLQFDERDAYQVCDDINRPMFSDAAAQVSALGLC